MHYESVRNINGPHSGLPQLSINISSLEASNATASPKRKRPSTSESEDEDESDDKANQVLKKRVKNIHEKPLPSVEDTQAPEKAGGSSENGRVVSRKRSRGGNLGDGAGVARKRSRSVNPSPPAQEGDSDDDSEDFVVDDVPDRPRKRKVSRSAVAKRFFV